MKVKVRRRKINHKFSVLIKSCLLSISSTNVLWHQIFLEKKAKKVSTYTERNCSLGFLTIFLLLPFWSNYAHTGISEDHDITFGGFEV
jgi:hypothetical protein